MTSKAQLNLTFPTLNGPGVGLGDVLNQLSEALSGLSSATAADAEVTIGGTPHAGDLVAITINGNADSYTSLTAGGLGTGTVTLGGAVQTGDVIEVTVGGTLVVYALVGGDTTLTLAATHLKDALNANTSFAASFIATSSGAVVTITALVPGTAGNVSLTAVVAGHTPTITATASGANLTGGANGDTLTTIAAHLRDNINADPVNSALVVATSAAEVITLAAKRKGTAANAYTLTAAVTGAGATLTATAEAATFGAANPGTGVNDVATIF